MIVVNFNDSDTVMKLLQHSSYDLVDLIVIVDNCSTDDSYQRLELIVNDKIHLIKSEKNGGYGYGNNLGIKYALDILGSDCYLIIANADVVFDDEVIYQLKDLLAKDETVAIAAPVIVEGGNLNRGWKLIATWQDSLMNLAGVQGWLKRRWLYYPKSFYQKDAITKETVFVDVVSGCFFMIKGEVMKQINYFDENLFLYYEENVIAVKLQKKNYKTVIDLRVKVEHKHSVSIDNSLKKIEKYKLQKISQSYYHKFYNQPSRMAMAMLFVTNKITLLMLSIYYLIH